eukprot:CAMPEP_0183351060 /NCGR_PEP_ID=MMETSP0164_2-20130417/23336_1 /TAXON_ID=221442 /ORGANISM="Coccolithus pelagicus ssp braarudi, Strain PLY182g" /LENGTH=217 /DNA_ID=CAMNT_0025523151 /DNA_START=79 /DNA_END=728 /DNA_ORIENTATION=+
MTFILFALGQLAMHCERLPSLPCGRKLELHTNDAEIGGRVWKAAPLLCAWLAEAQPEIEGASICELGAGTGAVGLYAAGLGATRVLLTDGSSRLVSLLRENAAVNSWARCSSIEVQQLTWGGDAVPEGCFDWVLGSDLTYDDEARALLCHTLHRLLANAAAKGHVTRALLAEEHGTPEPTSVDGLFRDADLDAFIATAEEHGLEIQPLGAAETGVEG